MGLFRCHYDCNITYNNIPLTEEEIKRAGSSEGNPARFCFFIAKSLLRYVHLCRRTAFYEAFKYEVMEQDLASNETVRLTLPETSLLPGGK